MKPHLQPLIILLSTALCITAAPAQAAAPLYLNVDQPREARIADLLSRLTLDEKISLVHADSKFTTAALPKYGAARRWMSDGPQGVREDIGPDTWAPAGRTDDFATAMPANIGLAASFDPQLAADYGNVIGEEASARRKNIMLGPGVNILRTPLNGRNSEYLGEDPFLAGRIAVAYINAVQSHGVASCVKHFAANNQETERGSINVEMDDRALHEIYLPAFKAAVTESHVWCVMTAYNRLRGTYCSENELLLNQILKIDWDFQGLVMSDWAGTHSTINAANHGLDLEMGSDKPYNDFYFANPLRDAITKQQVTPERLDDMARRNLRVMFATGMFDGPSHEKPKSALMSPAHIDAARRIQESAIVLLKNDAETLPLNPSKIKTIAVIGDIANRKFAHDGNSAAIKTSYEITPLEGIRQYAGPAIQIIYAQGYSHPSLQKSDKTPVATTTPEPSDDQLLASAVSAAKNADAVIILAGLYRNQDEEGVDRPDISMPSAQTTLIEKVAAANPRTTVVLTGGGPLDIEHWLPKVPALLQYWYGGTEGGNALANILFGKTNPSAKLPCSFPKSLADSPAHTGDKINYPGIDGKEIYAEGILVGYRWFDTKNIQPLFPFGYGLSYTTFQCSDLKLTTPPAVPPAPHQHPPLVTAQVTITNTGKLPGAEVVQLYIHDTHASLPRPLHELKAFQKVMLQPGEQRTISLPLTAASLSYYDPKSASWIAEAGDFSIDVGTSSRDLPLHATYTLPKTLHTKDNE